MRSAGRKVGKLLGFVERSEERKGKGKGKERV